MYGPVCEFRCGTQSARPTSRQSSADRLPDRLHSLTKRKVNHSQDHTQVHKQLHKNIHHPESDSHMLFILEMACTASCRPNIQKGTKSDASNSGNGIQHSSSPHVSQGVNEGTKEITMLPKVQKD